jgi:hypothetical protein
MNEEILAELKKINEQLGTVVKMLAEKKESRASFGSRDHRKGGYERGAGGFDRDGKGKGFGDRGERPFERKFNLDGKPRVRFDGRKRDAAPFKKKRF